MKRNKGITLIALVVTIVVLLILAGTSIAMLSGDNGIVNKATEAQIEQSHAQVKETVELKYSEYKMENTSMSNFIEYMIDKGCISNDGIINTQNLIGNKITLGNGTVNKDVYILEKVNNKYTASYYDNNGGKKEIWSITDTNSKELRDENMFEFEPTTGTIVRIKADYIIDYYNDRGETYFDTPDKWCELKKDVDTLIIPNSINGVAVKNVKCVGVVNAKNLIIEEGIETIGNMGGKYGQSELETVNLPESLVSMEKSAFENCTKLTTINIPGNLSTISNSAFFGCTNLANVTISDGVTTILSRAFQECKGLTSLRIPESVTSINEYAFYSCTNLTITLAKESPLSTSTKWGAKKVIKES